MALSFYPRLKCSTEVSERHVMLIFEKIPGGKFGKRFFERWGQNMELIISVLLGVSTIACIFGANALNQKKQASLMSAYAMLNESYKQYRKAAKTVYGEDADDKIHAEMAKDAMVSTYDWGYQVYLIRLRIDFTIGIFIKKIRFSV